MSASHIHIHFNRRCIAAYTFYTAIVRWVALWWHMPSICLLEKSYLGQISKVCYLQLKFVSCGHMWRWSGMMSFRRDLSIVARVIPPEIHKMCQILCPGLISEFWTSVWIFSVDIKYHDYVSSKFIHIC